MEARLPRVQRRHKRAALYVLMACAVAVAAFVSYVPPPDPFTIVPRAEMMPHVNRLPPMRKEFHFCNATHTPREGDVTAVLHFTMDKAEYLTYFAEQWRGPVSAVVFFRDFEGDAELEKARLQRWHESFTLVNRYVDIHCVYQNRTRYPANLLRNMGVRKARTDYVLVADIDLQPSTGAHKLLRAYAEEYIGLPPSAGKLDKPGIHKKNVLVIPVFNTDAKEQFIPLTKPELLTNIYHGSAALFRNEGNPDSARPTQTWARWLNGTEVYEAQYAWLYQPVVVRHKAAGVYEEQLAGLGPDTTLFTFMLAAKHYAFQVVPDVFLMHRDHSDGSWLGLGGRRKQIVENLGLACRVLGEIRKVRAPNAQSMLGEPRTVDCRQATVWGYAPKEPLL